ncbi:MAG TPA: PP2C family protein-serine/threonine phosphatase [Candidatus Acidoferrum sp.]|jgi:sigma-B regulation protein RsbU (phosphoserine phosphatase)|nr:PP2C family protein-serine/threonine phosphatase [Candidatus Acidoferrum sp.]
MSPNATIESISTTLSDLEREEARQIQLSLLPEGALITRAAEVAYRFEPFAGVGGDFADFFELPNGHVGIYIGDVVGKGLSAAMYATLVMGTLRGTHKTGTDTGSVLAMLNKRLLVRPVMGRYAATVYAVFDPATRELTFSNAGLPYPLLASGDQCKQLGHGGLPSGLFGGSSYECHRVQLAPGDAVLFATDGLTELRDRRDNDFSWDRLAEIWKSSLGRSAEEALERLFEEAQRFSSGARNRHDDITAIVLKVPN